MSRDAAELLPHEGVSRLIAAVVSTTETTLRCRARVPAASPLVGPLGVPGFVAIEIAAQAAAAAETLGRRTDGDAAGPRRGYLVGAKRLDVQRAHFPADVELEVTAELDGTAGELRIYRFEVSLGETTVASGLISTHAAAD